MLAAATTNRTLTCAHVSAHPPSVLSSAVSRRQRRGMHAHTITPVASMQAACTTHRQGASVRVSASANDEGVQGEAPVFLLPLVTDATQEKEWLAMQMREWLNQEWPAQETVKVHERLGEAVADAYIKARLQGGQNDMTDVLLSLSADLSTSFDFFDTFTDPFEVANKTTEILMLRDGADVCCASEGDKERVRRASEAFKAQ